MNTDKIHYVGLQFPHRSMNAPFQLFVREFRKPTLNLILVNR